MAVYTKKGDRGETSLYGGSSSQKTKLSKSSLQISAIGAIDETNSYLGVIRSLSEDRQLNNQLKKIQKDLLTIGSILSGSKLRFFQTKTKALEKEIDRREKKLPLLRKFVIPGSSRLAAHLHYGRTLIRRAECEVVTLNKIEKIKPQILSYLNCLSDFLFILAREANYKKGIKEEVRTGKGR